ncbi:tetratricopeptide repeat protein [Ferrovibrio sp.]|uniref:tetratricopeptide repeat protein n=1 Tax=Ferrovibrio sp. TaxID=1917215 RepID=UPI003511029F
MTDVLRETMLRQAGVGKDPMVLAESLLAQGQAESARQVLETLLKQSPNRPDAWFALGVAHTAANELKEAAKAFRRAIQLQPGHPPGYVHLGNTYLRLGRAGQALETYDEGLKHRPQDPLLHFNRGIALRQTGDIDGAIAEYKTAIAQHPPYFQAYFSLGNAHRDQGDKAAAEAAYRKAVEIEPRFADGHANLAGLLAEREDYPAAIDSCRSVLALVPGHIHALRNLSLCLYRTGHHGESAEIAMLGLKVAPDETMLHYTVGEALYGLVRDGQAERARTLAETWRQAHSGNAIAQHMAAAILDEPAPARAGDDYVRETFDRFASDFEQVLGGLGYRVPERLCAAAHAALGERAANLTILDAGCGTGLCAPHLKPLARRLVGVDLSGGMLEKARARGLYDSLHEAELGAFLAADRDRYDLAIAADVFCYFGELGSSFRALAGRMVHGGLLGFTVEAMQGPTPAAGYRLGPTGRYQHDADYVRRELQAAGYETVRWDDTEGRVEMGQPVPCFMILARRT